MVPGRDAVGSGSSPSSASFGFSAGSVAPAPEGRPGFKSLSAPHVGEYVGFDTEQDIRLAGILPVDSDREQLGPITTHQSHT